jgi:hypothetical protein
MLKRVDHAHGSGRSESHDAVHFLEEEKSHSSGREDSSFPRPWVIGGRVPVERNREEGSARCVGDKDQV